MIIFTLELPRDAFERARERAKLELAAIEAGRRHADAEYIKLLRALAEAKEVERKDD